MILFEKFCDYMYYLLTSPFKKINRTKNQWYILFEVLGSYFDDAMGSLHKAREQTMLATCDPEMLPVHADDRKLIRYIGEEDENFRKRIANYTEVCQLGGTNPGIILGVKSLGYSNIKIVKAKDFTGDQNRWAEFYLFIQMGIDDQYPIGFGVLRTQVQRTKEVGAKDNYLFIMTNDDTTAEEKADARTISHIVVENQEFINTSSIICMTVENAIDSTMHIDTDLWYLDGTFLLDGTTRLDANREEY